MQKCRNWALRLYDTLSVCCLWQALIHRRYMTLVFCTASLRTVCGRFTVWYTCLVRPTPPCGADEMCPSSLWPAQIQIDSAEPRRVANVRAPKGSEWVEMLAQAFNMARMRWRRCYEVAARDQKDGPLPKTDAGSPPKNKAYGYTVHYKGLLSRSRRGTADEDRCCAAH